MKKSVFKALKKELTVLVGLLRILEPQVAKLRRKATSVKAVLDHYLETRK